MSHSASSFAPSPAFTREELAGHRARLKAIRPRIDFSTPSSYFVLLNRAKKDQIISEWAHGVDSANLALLSRMTAIHSSTHWDDHSSRVHERERRKAEQSALDRLNEQRRIEHENRLLLERLRAQKSSYGTGNWMSHAAAYEKHLKEVRPRQLLIHDPLHAKAIIREEKLKAKQKRVKKHTEKLAPIDSTPLNYDRDPSLDTEDTQAGVDAVESEGAEVAAFDDVDPSDLIDQSQVGAVSLSEFIAPQSHTHLLLHQDGHTIDDHHVILTVHEVNRQTARVDVDLGEWSAFTAVPPVFLHAYLIRSYDLDTGVHCHLYLPFEPMRALGKADKRVEKLIGMMGFTEVGELYFKQRLMPPVKGKGKGKGKVVVIKGGKEEKGKANVVTPPPRVPEVTKEEEKVQDNTEAREEAVQGTDDAEGEAETEAVEVQPAQAQVDVDETSEPGEAEIQSGEEVETTAPVVPTEEERPITAIHKPTEESKEEEPAIATEPAIISTQ